MSEGLIWLFGGDLPPSPMLLHQACARGVLVYLLGVLIVRAGKSRLIGRASALDVILGFLLGSLLSRGITGSAAMSTTLASSAAIVGAHWLLTRVTLPWHRLGELFKGHSEVLVQEGRVREAALQAAHLSREDLAEGLRLQGVERVEHVHLAVKERSGEISVIERAASHRPRE
ncbi:MAG TPA: YetF domain-containing protein [Myxococcota bacterium]|nr:YetF domain-containing protein [Myxococcota bacterium]